MFGRLIAGLIVVGLAIGVWALWPSGDSDTTSTTAPIAAQTTVTTEPSTTSSTAASSTTTEAAPDIIDTEEEAEAVLRELWFGWFEGIYNQDEERIKEVVASEVLLDNAADQFGAMEFLEIPDRDSLTFEGTELLFGNSECTVIWSTVEVPFRGGDSSGAHVMRPVDGKWKAVSVWANANDLWENDCDAQLEPLS